MKIILGCDHGGFELKERIKFYLENDGHRVVDVGTNSATEAVDYPYFANLAVKQVLADKSNLGILVCGTGTGICIAANRHRGIRAAVCHSVDYARLAREHNHANILGLGGRFLSFEDAKPIVDAFLSTAPQGGRHLKRLAMLEQG